MQLIHDSPSFFIKRMPIGIVYKTIAFPPGNVNFSHFERTAASFPVNARMSRQHAASKAYKTLLMEWKSEFREYGFIAELIY